MAAKPVSLSVHKNKVERKNKRDLAQRIQRETAAICREEDIRAFAFVGIAANGEAYAIWDTGAIMPQWAFSSVIEKILEKDIHNEGVTDDFRAPIIRKPESD